MPNPLWNNSLVAESDPSALADLLRQTLTAQGYTLYNPFGVIPGKSYAHNIRLFVSPSDSGWVRVVGEVDADLCAALSARGLCLSLSLDPARRAILTYQSGASVEPFAVLQAHLAPKATAEKLAAVLRGEFSPIAVPVAESAVMGGVPLSALPDKVQAMMGKVDGRTAEKMFAKMSGQYVSGGQAEAAQQLMQADAPPDWAGVNGQRVLALMRCLRVPDDWQTPDFVALRDAYPLYARLQRNPNARAYPGDAELMAKAPNALTYTPIYGGKSA